jgi:hypothetical protein
MRNITDTETVRNEKVDARWGSIVYALDGAVVDAYWGSYVMAGRGSTVNAYERSTVRAERGSLVHAFGHATVHAYEGAEVRAGEGSTVYAYRRSSRFEDVVKRVEDEAGPEGRAELDAFRRHFARAWRNEGA